MKEQLVTQPTAKPNRKWSANNGYGAGVALLVIAAEFYAASAADQYPALAWLAEPNVVPLLPVVIGGAVGYLTRERG